MCSSDLSGDEDTAIAAYQAAQTGYDHVLTLLPDNPAVLFSRGQVRMSLGDSEGARADAEWVLAIDDESPEGHLLRGQLY